VAEITAGLVKQLRERTGGGMMDCKRVLEESGGDLEKAALLLRERGMAKADKKAGRATSEGRICDWRSSDGRVGALLELTCETDFVAKTEPFARLGSDLVRLVGEHSPADLPALLALRSGDSSVEERLKQTIGTLGENMAVRRFARLEAGPEGLVSSYIHAGGKIGTLVQVSAPDVRKPEVAELAHNVCMHVAAMAPASLSREDLSPQLVEREKQVLRKQAEGEGKPPEILEKMVLGRLNKFFREVVLLEQPLVMDADTSVGKAAQALQARIAAFRRLQLGEEGAG
jgi:elongation factor Ts